MFRKKLNSGRVVIIGSGGQLGQALMAQAPHSIGLTREQLDLSKPNVDEALSSLLEPLGPISGVINAAAYTAVDRAESEVDLAMCVNGEAPGQIAGYCEKVNVPFVHFSTDYVFSGQARTPYRLSEQTSPINSYGHSKLAGEVAIRKTNAAFVIMRTSWVFDGINNNFLTTMLRLAETRSSLSVVADQIGRPTYTVDLARAALHALQRISCDKSKGGIYHVSNSGRPTSWEAFARSIFEASDLDVEVVPISTDDYPTPAQRPAYSVLDISDFEECFEFTMPCWQDALARALKARGDNSRTKK